MQDYVISLSTTIVANQPTAEYSEASEITYKSSYFDGVD